MSDGTVVGDERVPCFAVEAISYVYVPHCASPFANVNVFFWFFLLWLFEKVLLCLIMLDQCFWQAADGPKRGNGLVSEREGEREISPLVFVLV